MKLFLIRLLTVLGYIAGLVLSVTGFAYFLLLLEMNETLKTVTGWIVAIVLGIPLSIYVLAALIVGINWLFVEPFKKVR